MSTVCAAGGRSIAARRMPAGIDKVVTVNAAPPLGDTANEQDSRGSARSGSCSLPDADDIRARHQCVNVIRPSLHHLRAVLEIGGLVVCRSHLVALLVRQLPLDHIGAPT